ncbi:MAG: cation:proton antiporter [Bacilli bacterium]|jgi:monovalent cation:proton antiporter-2 (CPA2) family protein|nr:cation:proton antiporter [Bacilli bacterium]
MSEIAVIVIILIFTTLFGAIFKKIGLPAVVGQLLVGIILGPAILNIVQPSHTIEFISEIGVIFLMFMAGLESDLSLLKKHIKPSLSVAIFGVIIPIVVFYLLCKYTGYNNIQAMFIGLVYAATSISISVEVFQEYRKLKSEEGSTVLGAAIVDDIIAVLLLSVFLSFFAKENSDAISNSLWMQSLLQVLFIFVAYLFVKWIVPKVMPLIYQLPIWPSATIGAVIICLLLSELARFCGFSDVIGAFFAGVAVAQTHNDLKHKIENNLKIIGYTFFVPVFFTSIGLNMNFLALQENILLIIVFTIIAILTKLGGCAIAAKLSGFNWKSSYTIGAGMVSRGEMALIIAQIGFSSALISDVVYSELVIVIIVATLIAPFLIRHSFNIKR